VRTVVTFSVHHKEHHIDPANAHVHVGPSRERQLVAAPVRAIITGEDVRVDEHSRTRRRKGAVMPDSDCYPICTSLFPLPEGSE